MIKAIVIILALAIFPTIYVVLSGRPDSISYFAGVVAGLGVMIALQCFERYRQHQRVDLDQPQV